MTAEDSTKFTIIFLDLIIKTTRKITSPVCQTYSWIEDGVNLVRFREYGPKRIKEVIFCFALLRWCHGWASNILSGGCWNSRHPPQLKYWIPIHHDPIEDGQSKNISSYILILSWIFFSFHWHCLLSKSIHHFICFI